MAEKATRPLIDAPSRKEIRRIVARRDAVARQRFGFIHDALNWEQREFLTLLPLLLHINHAALPGYCGNEVPAGIAGYEPDRDTLLSARAYVRSLKKERRAQRFPPILGLYLIGSSGTLGQDRDSDFDIWICHHPALTPSQLQGLEQKARALEEHGARLGLQVHFFILHAQGFRDGQHNALSDESSGNTQHHLLLEEFYRTGLRIAGRPPLWWIVPPQHLYHYREYCDVLVGQRFVQEDDWLDFGGLEDISPAEFFSAAHWQLFKGIQVPYKSLLKLLLFECYATEFPAVHWVAEQVQELYHAEHEIDAIDVDPYLLMMQRIESHLAREADAPRRQLARRAFYLKSGARLSRPREDWKTPILRSLCNEWGWDEGEIINLEHHREWKLDRVIAERNQLVGELSRCYRMLTAVARREDLLEQIDTRELSLLGRKLYSALERRPGKIDRVNPGLSNDIGQEQIWLRPHPENGAWQCFLFPPEEGSEAVKSTLGLVELLLWLSSNGAIDNSTRIDLPPTEGPVHPQEHLHILRVLRRHFPPERHHSAPLGEFARRAQGRHALAVINVLQPGAHLAEGRVLVSERGDPLSFGTRRQNLVLQVDHVHENSWGELHVAHYRGADGLLDMLCRHLELFAHHPRPGSLPCHCETAGHGRTIARRITLLADHLLAHFQRHGTPARYLLQLGEDFHVIDRERGHFEHRPVGRREDLLDFLGEVHDHFRPTVIDAAGLADSPLPLLARLNRPGHTQIGYQVTSGGIRCFVLDPGGALVTQELAHAGEKHFLVQQQRFFNTLGEWQEMATGAGQTTPVEYLRLERSAGKWQARAVQVPGDARPDRLELILSTGPRGPWMDGFSLLSGEREFNSVALGEHIYTEVARYLRELRRSARPYPFYLTGVLGGGLAGEPGLSVSELIRFKVRIEQRLNRVAARA